MPSHDELFELLSSIVLTPGVSGAEEPVAQVIAGHLLAVGFAEREIERDQLGNVFVRLGPDGEPQRLLLAHMDEIGQRIASIREDGRCTLHPLGGSDPQLWEGTPVEVHTAGGAVPGCIAPVSHHITFGPGYAQRERLTQRELLLDLGATNPTDVTALGVALLDSLTWPKRIVRLPHNDVQARSLDDRFGCTALVQTAAALKRNPPPVPTVIGWTVQEEIGLRGARCLAARFPHCAEVIAIDSFCVGAGPRDSKLWANAVLGGGPVLRSWDSTTLVPDGARRALLAKAQRLGCPLQFGYMAGGNDASEFELSGARVFGLSVCVQYSHTNSERINLDDLAALSRLLIAWCASAAD